MLIFVNDAYVYKKNASTDSGRGFVNTVSHDSQGWGD